MKVFLGYNHSCDANYQYYQIYNYFYDYLVEDVESADTIVIPSTCTGTEKMIYHTLIYIESLYERNKNAKIYVTGCITRTFKNEKYSKMIKKYFDTRNIKAYSIFELGKLLEDILKEEYNHKADEFGCGMIKNKTSKIYISTGCMNNCSFCKATYQNLPLKSVEIEVLKDYIDNIDKKEVPKLNMAAINICQYGYDLYKEYKLPELIEYIESKDNIKEISLLGFAFKDAIQNDFKRIFKNSKKKYEIIGSLESGSDRILKLMNKGFTASEFTTFTEGLDNILFSLSIIAGFPTETLDDVKKTLDVLGKVNCSYVEIHKYINSSIVDSNKYDKLETSEIETHARIYQKVLTKRKVPNIISINKDYKE